MNLLYLLVLLLVHAGSADESIDLDNYHIARLYKHARLRDPFWQLRLTCDPLDEQWELSAHSYYIQDLLNEWFHANKHVLREWNRWIDSQPLYARYRILDTCYWRFECWAEQARYHSDRKYLLAWFTAKKYMLEDWQRWFESRPFYVQWYEKLKQLSVYFGILTDPSD
jgi:hypothetical protein